MVTYTQLINGLVVYVSNELNVGGNNSFILKFLLKMLLKPETKDYIKERYSTVIDMFCLIDEQDNIDLDKVYEVAKDTMEDKPYKFDTPLGCLTVTPSDLEKIYTTIKGA